MPLANRDHEFTREIRDTNEHAIPSESEGDRQTGFRLSPGRGLTLAKLVNTHDQPLTVQLHGSTFNDPLLGEKDEDTDPVTIPAASNGTPGVVTFVTDVNWSRVVVTAEASVAPTEGRLMITFQSTTHGTR